MQFKCPRCSTLLSAADNLAGKTIACSCGHQFVAPTPQPVARPVIQAAPVTAAPTNAAPIKAAPVSAAPVKPGQGASAPNQGSASQPQYLMIRCPCGRQLKVAATARGQNVQCPCGKTLSVPLAAGAAPVTATAVVAKQPAKRIVSPANRLADELRVMDEIAVQRAEEAAKEAVTSSYRRPSYTSSNNADAEVERGRYIHHEAAVRGIGALYYFGAAYCGIVAGVWTLLLLSGNIPDELPDNDFARRTVPILVISLATVIGIFQAILAAGLQEMKLWAKVVATIFLALGLLAFPLGTALNIYCLWLLYSSDGNYLFTREYAEIRRKTSHMQPGISTFFSVLISIGVFLIVAGFIFGLIGGFLNS